MTGFFPAVFLLLKFKNNKFWHIPLPDTFIAAEVISREIELKSFKKVVKLFSSKFDAFVSDSHGKHENDLTEQCI